MLDRESRELINFMIFDLEGTSNLHSSVNELAKIRVMYHNQMLEMENGDIGTLKYLVARYTCEE